MLQKSNCECKKLLFTYIDDQKISFRCPRCKDNRVAEIVRNKHQYRCNNCNKLFFKIVDNKIEIKCTQCKKMHYKPMSLNNRNAEQRSQPMELVDSSN